MTERERLVRLIDNGPAHFCNGCNESPEERAESVEMLADHLLAEGVIVPPCKVGDTVYALSQMRDKRVLPFINEYEATSIGIGKKKCIVYHEMDGFIKLFKQDDFGKTVFLTREEAEKALAERREE